MNQPVDIRPDHAEIVQDILATRLPERTSVWVFGSRAKWTAKTHSDLDLAIKGKERLPFSVLSDLAEAFSESDLPFKVDVVDWHAITPALRAVIDRDGLSLSWPLLPLSHFVDPERGICYGIVQPGEAVKEGVPIIRVNNFGPGGIDISDALRVAPSIEAKYARSRLRGGELLVTLVGSVGQSAIAPAELKGWNVARAVGVIPVKDTLRTRWIKFVLASTQAQDFLHQRANTTVQTTINLRDLSELPIPTPPRPAMEGIVGLLGALDDKIELNRRMNETLEAMARGIFKDWFVDFGPTRAKMEGRPPYLAPDIWSLFPDRLDDEGKPEGWEARTLDSLFDVSIGRTPPRKESEHFLPSGVGVPWLSIKSMGDVQAFAFDTAETLAPSSVKKYNVKVVPPGTVLVSFKLTVGRVVIAAQNMATNEAIAHLVRHQKTPVSDVFTYCAMKEFDYATLGSTSSIATAVNSASIKSIALLIASQPLQNAFTAVAEVLLDRIKANVFESRTLAATRDLLLPKLMSGEVRVKDAEKLLEEAT